jgi:hypothetical protein
LMTFIRVSTRSGVSAGVVGAVLGSGTIPFDSPYRGGASSLQHTEIDYATVKRRRLWTPGPRPTAATRPRSG